MTTTTLTDEPLTATWERSREALLRFVLSRVRDRAAAEDIVHDVLLRALRSQNALRERGKLTQWLFSITRNAIVDHFRAQRPTEELPAEIEMKEGEGAGTATRELAQCLHGFIDRLSPKLREALLLSEIEGLTQQETAERLGISLSGAKSRVQRARATLEETLRSCCRFELDRRGAIIDYERRAERCGDAPCRR